MSGFLSGRSGLALSSSGNFKKSTQQNASLPTSMSQGCSESSIRKSKPKYWKVCLQTHRHSTATHQCSHHCDLQESLIKELSDPQGIQRLKGVPYSLMSTSKAKCLCATDWLGCIPTTTHDEQPYGNCTVPPSFPRG
jgi:hypothetical protein